MPVEPRRLKAAATSDSSQSSKKAAQVCARATPNRMLTGVLNIETIFHISFHQHQGRCPADHFLIMQIGRNLNHLPCSSVWQREAVHLMGQLHKAKWGCACLFNFKVIPSNEKVKYKKVGAET